jgi:hypothetical protein
MVDYGSNWILAYFLSNDLFTQKNPPAQEGFSVITVLLHCQPATKPPERFARPVNVNQKKYPLGLSRMTPKIR